MAYSSTNTSTNTNKTVSEYSSTNISTNDRETTYDDSVSLGPEVSSKTIQTTFGREEDYIELHIQNTAGQLIYSETNFQDYELNEDKNEISFNPEKTLTDRGYISGQYILKVHLHRNKIFHSSHFPFSIKEISTSRREIKSIAEDTNNDLFDEAILNWGSISIRNQFNAK